MKISILYIYVFVLIGCASNSRYQKSSHQISLNDSLEVINSSSASDLTDVINPYKHLHDSIMNAVVCYSDTPMPKLKNVTESLLGNFVANLTFEVANEKADFCLLNFGGLRTSIPKGPITRGKLFELMPFENSLIIVEISDEKFRELIKYLINVNGQPVSNLTLSVSKSDTICKIGKDEYIPNGQNIKVLTTDYLANGGDHMNFFIDPILKQNLGIKLRDAIISHCSSKNTKGEFIGSTIENKFKFQ